MSQQTHFFAFIVEEYLPPHDAVFLLPILIFPGKIARQTATDVLFCADFSSYYPLAGFRFFLLLSPSRILIFPLIIP